jgi:hypothetical protein
MPLRWTPAGLVGLGVVVVALVAIVVFKAYTVRVRWAMGSVELAPACTNTAR